ncbi:hypothetical protein [Flaviaesturariibacter amylovorans]|uniref:Uncharacterized protein n=1 Tax=Flaviaesturariibacter amylovorans TaxID=1084520 RepID=A0ABP8HT40_9BACT
MKRALASLLLIVCGNLWAGAQTTYYDFYYTNLPPARVAPYMSAFRTGFDWLYLQRYTGDSCSGCTRLAPTATLQAAALPTLSQALFAHIPQDLYQRNNVPGSTYHIVGTKAAPYIIRTLYTLANDKVEPLYQVRIEFTDAPGTPAVQDISVYDPKTAKRFSRKLVLSNYKRTIPAKGR